jgi:hypothetical protein
MEMLEHCPRHLCKKVKRNSRVQWEWGLWRYLKMTLREVKAAPDPSLSPCMMGNGSSLVALEVQ